MTYQKPEIFCPVADFCTFKKQKDCAQCLKQLREIKEKYDY